MKLSVNSSRATRVVLARLVRAFGALLAVGLAVTASASAAPPFVYVPNVDANTISEYGSGSGGLLTSLGQPTVGAGTEPNVVALTPDGTSAYVSNALDGTISQYDVDPLSGQLTPKSEPTVTAGPEPGDVAVAPDGSSVYVTDGKDRSIWQYDINPTTGGLTAKIPATVNPGGAPVAIAVAGNGEHAYVVDLRFQTVTEYTIDPASGALTATGTAPAATGSFPVAITLSSDGKSAYVANEFDNTVSQYNIDPTTGALTAKTRATVATASEPVAVALAPDGKSAYVAALSDNFISEYNVDASTGALTTKFPANIATGSLPVAVALTRDGTSAYVSDSRDDTISAYDVGAGGVLAAKSQPPVNTGHTPNSIAIGPASYRRICGTCVLATNLTNIRVTGGLAILTNHLSLSTAVGILVQRIVEKRLVTVGRVPFGPHRKGRLRIRWNLRVNGRKLTTGRYQITLRALDSHGRVTARAHPLLLVIHQPDRTTDAHPS
jgi:DNA-binding beta-propeller fold protein YncE